MPDTVPLATLPADQIIASTGGIWFGTTANPDDANADYIYTPSAAGKSFVFNSTATQPVIVRQLGGTPGTDELQIYHDGTNGYIDFPGTSTTALIRMTGGSSAIRLVASDQLQLTDNDSQPYNLVCVPGAGFRLRNTGYFGWRPDNTNVANDTALTRAAAAVVSVTNGSSGAGWLQNSAGHKMLAANATSVSDTLANTNLAWTLIAGRSYAFSLKVVIGNSVNVEGVKLALTSDGTLTAGVGDFDLTVMGFNGTGTPDTTAVDALGDPIIYTSLNSGSHILLAGQIKPTVGGVLTLQIAANAFSSGTVTLLKGTAGLFNDCVSA